MRYDFEFAACKAMWRYTVMRQRTDITVRSSHMGGEEPACKLLRSEAIM